MALQKEYDKAREFYSKSLDTAELVFAPGAKQILEIQQKIKEIA
jgi:hypothetical protein